MIALMLMAGLGGFAGAACRCLAGMGAKRLFGDKYPAGTLLVNIAGCLIIGAFIGLWESHALHADIHAMLLKTGFCGGLTTFSSFSNEALGMLQKGQWAKFVFYVAPSLVLGLLCVWGGAALAR